jgi:hypothetical protein
MTQKYKFSLSNRYFVTILGSYIQIWNFDDDYQIVHEEEHPHPVIYFTEFASGLFITRSEYHIKFWTPDSEYSIVFTYEDPLYTINGGESHKRSHWGLLGLEDKKLIHSFDYEDFGCPKKIMPSWKVVDIGGGLAAFKNKNCISIYDTSANAIVKSIVHADDNVVKDFFFSNDVLVCYSMSRHDSRAQVKIWQLQGLSEIPDKLENKHKEGILVPLKEKVQEVPVTPAPPRFSYALKSKLPRGKILCASSSHIVFHDASYQKGTRNESTKVWDLEMGCEIQTFVGKEPRQCFEIQEGFLFLDGKVIDINSGNTLSSYSDSKGYLLPGKEPILVIFSKGLRLYKVDAAKARVDYIAGFSYPNNDISYLGDHDFCMPSENLFICSAANSRWSTLSEVCLVWDAKTKNLINQQNISGRITHMQAISSKEIACLLETKREESMRSFLSPKYTTLYEVNIFSVPKLDIVKKIPDASKLLFSEGLLITANSTTIRLWDPRQQYKLISFFEMPLPKLTPIQKELYERTFPPIALRLHALPNGIIFWMSDKAVVPSASFQPLLLTLQLTLPVWLQPRHQ